VTQNPLDVPDTVLAQLGNRIQHALRAFTPRDKKAVKAAAQTFRQNPTFDTEKAITELGVGEALVSVLDEKGVPTMVERTLIRPPSGKLGPVDPAVRDSLVRNSPIYGEYDKAIDRESAYEILQKRAEKRQAAAEAEAGRKAEEKEQRSAERASKPSRRSDSTTDRFVKNVAGSVGRQVGAVLVRQLVRGLLGGLLRR
jgi:DNA helicase HerA-like ATPase